MWTLKELRSPNIPTAKINDKWVPARPLNFLKKYAPFWQRVKDAWAVFSCEAEAFIWPENQ